MEFILKDANSIIQHAQRKLDQISSEADHEQVKILFTDVSDLTCLALDYFTDEDKTEANARQIDQAIDLLDHVSIRASELSREVSSKPCLIDGYLKAEASKLNTFLRLAIETLSITDPADLYAYALASYCPTGEADQEADLIVNDESMKFLELRGFNGTVKELHQEYADMLEQVGVTDVLIIHIGTIQKLSNALAKAGV